MAVFGQSGCIRAKGLNLHKKGCTLEKWLYSGKLVEVGQKWLYSGKVVVIGQAWLYSGIVVVFLQKWLYWGKGGCIRPCGCIRAKSLYSSNSGSILSKVVVCRQSGSIRA